MSGFLYLLFLVQSLLFGAEVGVAYWEPGPVTVGGAAFVGCITAHTIATTARSAA